MQPLVADSPEELDAILARADAEAWSQIAIYSQKRFERERVPLHFPPACRVRLSYPLRHIPAAILRLSALRQLAVCSTACDSADANALASATHLSNLTSLALPDNCVGDKGAEVFARSRSFSRLISLDLSDNGITELGTKALAQAGPLESLTSLNLSGNSIGDAGAEALATARQLSDLAILDLSDNWIGRAGARHLAAATHLPNLRSLSLSNNFIGDRGARALAGAAHFPKLVWLNLAHNRIGKVGMEALADTLSLSSLASLDLSDNFIGDAGVQSLARATHLVSLIALFLRHNGIGNDGVHALSTAPHLASLELIDLSFNLITELPPAFATFTSLEELDLESNPLPREILDLADAGVSSLFKYLSRLREAEDHFECKLVLVGAGQMGKSCLLEALLGKEPVKERKSTRGVEIARVPLLFDHPKRSDIKLLLNCWDFGGQEHYEPTHQFFFSPRSIYLVLWSPRQGADACRVEEWLRLIQHRVGSRARVILVPTYARTYDVAPDVSVDDLREKFGQDFIVGLHAVDNFAEDEHEPEMPFGVPALKRAIADVAATMPEKFPPTMRVARQEVIGKARDGRTWMDFVEFQVLAASAGESDAALLAKLLDIQGHVVYHEPQDAIDPLDPPRTHGVVLQPEWLAKAVAVLLDDPETRKAKGIISHDRMRELWHQQGYPQKLHAYFRDLMEKCYVSYRIPGRSESLLPQLLKGERPDDLPWHPSAEVDSSRPQLTAVYAFYEVPRGLLPVLIVATHKYRVRTEWHWPQGTFLNDTQTDAEAVMELRARDLFVTVRGSDPGRFMNALLREIEQTVTSVWDGIELDDPRGMTAYVPCYQRDASGDPCTGREKLYFLHRVLMRDRNGTRTCDKCDKDLEITRLLHGFHLKDRKLDLAINRVHSAVMEHDKRSTQQHVAILDTQLTAKKNAPSLFTLFPRESRDPAFSHYNLTLWCEGLADNDMHAVCPPGSGESGDYHIKRPRNWLRTAAPAISWTCRLGRLIAPVGGEILKQTADFLNDADFRRQIELAEKTLASLPDGDLDIGETDPLPSNSPIIPQEAALRVFHDLLNKEAKDRQWGGLAPTRINETEFRWLCPPCQQRAKAASADQ